MAATSFLISLLLSPLVLLFIIRWRKSSCVSDSRLPPSPPRLPLIGNLLQLGTHPHRSLRDLSKKYGPLMLLHLGRSKTLVVSSPEMAKDIFKNHDATFSSRPKSTAADIIFYGAKDVAFAPYGEYWKQSRKICVQELLSLQRVHNYQNIREEEAAAMVGRIRKAAGRAPSTQSTVNLSEVTERAINSIVSRSVFGRNFVEEERPTRFGELTKKIIIEIMAFSVGDFFPMLGWVDTLTGLKGRLRESFKEIDTFFDQVMEENKAAVGAACDYSGGSEVAKNFVEILLRLQMLGMLNYEFTHDNMKAILVDMFFGASDTTAATLEWIVAELVRKPTTMKKVQEEIRRVVRNKSKIDTNDINQMNFLKCVVKETLRLHPPIPCLVPRETTASVNLGEFHIPAKTSVLINAWAIQRDPKVWDNAEEFIPERFDKTSIGFKGQDFEFIPFGAGRRGCPGIASGLATAEFVSANVLCWFDWELPEGVSPDEVDMGEVYGLSVRKKAPLNLVPKPYNP